MERAQRFEIEHRPVGSLKPYAGNARRHSKTQLKQIADSITRFGFTNPVLISDETADLTSTHPPHHVAIDGHVTGNGAIRHREFAMGAGEMSEPAFTEFLTETLGGQARRARDGAIAFVCMDWRHMRELLAA